MQANDFHLKEVLSQNLSTDYYILSSLVYDGHSFLHKRCTFQLLILTLITDLSAPKRCLRLTHLCKQPYRLTFTLLKTFVAPLVSFISLTNRFSKCVNV